MKAFLKDIEHIEKLYEGRKVFHGEMHDHANSGGTSDGEHSLSHWKSAMKAQKIDFAAILDHRQVSHMYLPEWEDGIFISGTEAGTWITDCDADRIELHYNMVAETPKQIEDYLNEFEDYEFEGAPDGHFVYPKFTHEEFARRIDAMKKHGIFMTFAHPKELMNAKDPMEYYFRDETGMEVFYRDFRNSKTVKNYNLWTELLKMGKRIWVCAGCDSHSCASDTALTTLYAEEKKDASYLKHIKQGDFVCGPVGIKMCIGDTLMGGRCDIDGKRLIVAVGDFHKIVNNPERRYRIDILNDKGVVSSDEFSIGDTAYFAIDTEKADFYRVEIFDLDINMRIALGNPIWNKE